MTLFYISKLSEHQKKNLLLRLKQVCEFYSRDNVSHQLPYKNLTRRVKDHLGVYHRVPVRVMEITLKKAYDTFKFQHPTKKISQRKFEMLCPKNIRLHIAAQRLQGCCTYHTNMDYVCKACAHLFLVNGRENLFQTNDKLIEAVMCNSKSLLCIFGQNDCKNFPKIDGMKIHLLKCTLV